MFGHAQNSLIKIYPTTFERIAIISMNASPEVILLAALKGQKI